MPISVSASAHGVVVLESRQTYAFVGSNHVLPTSVHPGLRRAEYALRNLKVTPHHQPGSWNALEWCRYGLAHHFGKVVIRRAKVLIDSVANRSAMRITSVVMSGTGCKKEGLYVKRNLRPPLYMPGLRRSRDEVFKRSPGGDVVKKVLIRLKLVMTALLLLAATTMYAATYYVAKTGSDSHTGLASSCSDSANAWLTISHAGATAVAGDTVNVCNGTYAEHVSINNSGSAGSPITFQSVNRWGAVISPASGTGNIVTAQGSYTTITGFEILGYGGTFQTGIKFQNAAGGHGIATHNKIHHIGLTDCVGSVGILTGQANSLIDSNLIYDFGEASCNQDEAIYLGDGDGITVTNNIVGDANYSGANLIGIQVNGEGATTADFPSNTTIANNTIFNVSGWGISMPCWNVPAAHTCDHNVFNNNIIVNGGSSGGSIKAINAGGTWGSNNMYANNLIFNAGSTALASGQTLTNTVTSDPLFVNYTGDGTGNYQLQAGSPAIAAGTSTGCPAKDFDGNSRPQNSASDIGAYEFVVAAPAPPTGLTATVH